MVDLSKIKPGDELTVRCVAQAPTGGGWSVHTMHDRFAKHVRAEDIVSHTPKALAVGDRVRNRLCARFPEEYHGGEIIAISGLFAWVSFTSEPGTARLSDLERLP